RRRSEQPKKTVRDGDQNKTDREEHARSDRLKEDKFTPAATLDGQHVRLSKKNGSNQSIFLI
ncbi:MAG: hypothetical protein ACKODU_04085, partial [Limnohabitans sp.]